MVSHGLNMASRFQAAISSIGNNGGIEDDVVMKA
jgi:hypothetical protein